MTKIDIFSGFLGSGKTTLIKKLLEEAYSGEKIVLIENEFGEIGIDGGFLAEAGIQINEMNSGCICCSLVGDFAAAGRGGKVPDVRQAFAAATNGEFRILLQHQPKEAAANIKEVGVDLQLSGHTHGGVAPIIRQLVSKHNSGYSRGIYRYGDSVLYVSPGVGQWAGFPIRFFNPSEIAVFRLVKHREGSRGNGR